MDGITGNLDAITKIAAPLPANPTKVLPSVLPNRETSIAELKEELAENADSYEPRGERETSSLRPGSVKENIAGLKTLDLSDLDVLKAVSKQAV